MSPLKSLLKESSYNIKFEKVTQILRLTDWHKPWGTSRCLAHINLIYEYKHFLHFEYFPSIYFKLILTPTTRFYSIICNTTMLKDLCNLHGYPFKRLGDSFYNNVLAGARVEGREAMALKGVGRRGRRPSGGGIGGGVGVFPLVNTYLQLFTVVH